MTLKSIEHRYTGHTQKNGAFLIVFTIKTAPFFCVCPVFFWPVKPTESSTIEPTNTLYFLVMFINPTHVSAATEPSGVQGHVHYNIHN
jgi:hypothetical protein